MKKKEYEKLECPDCDIYLEELKQVKQKCKELSETLQFVQSNATKMELILQQNNLLEKVSDISDVEAICVEQLRLLKDKSSLQALSETDTKILDTLYKNLKMARGEAIEKDKERKKAKKLSSEELLVLVTSEIKE